jgi:GntR family transcriptional regulator, arabinose operon transcriptional repressor
MTRRKMSSEIVSFKPKYRQLEDILRQRIRSGEYPEYSKMPTEHALVKEFGISRHTVIKALNELYHDGLLTRRQGSGTYVGNGKHSACEKIGVLSDFEAQSAIFSVALKEISKAALARLNASVLFRHILPEDLSLPDNIDVMLKDGVRGFILFPQFNLSSDFPLIKYLINKKIPFTTVIGEPVEGLAPILNSVYGDNYHGGVLAGKHLVECGYDNFRILFPPFENFDLCCYHQRRAGFKQALKEAGIPDNKINTLQFVTTAEEEDTLQIGSYKTGVEFAKSLPEGRTGVFALQSDYSAISFLHAMHENNIDVPGKVGICGYDNMDISRSRGVALTTIDTNVPEIGRRAVEILMEQIDNPKHEPQSIKIPEKLIPRNTTGAS